MLTYKSIQDAINAHVGAGELFCLESQFLGVESPRAVFASAEVMEIVNGPPWPPGKDGRLGARLRGLLDDFTEGGFITVAENPFNKDSRALMARVHPVADEVWDFRCLDPRPGIRAFGRFGEVDTFIVLSWNFRENLENNNNSDPWHEEVSYCKQEWRRLFGSLAPHRGNNINEYISFNVRSV